MTIIAVSKAQDSDEFIVEKIAEDIWLLENGGAISFLDLFIKADEKTAPIKSLMLAMLGKVEQVTDVSYFFEQIERRWGKSVATDQYKLGVTKEKETDQTLTMCIDGLLSNISHRDAKFTPKTLKSSTTGNFGSVLKVSFSPPIEAGEVRGLKICSRLSKLSRADNSVWELSLYPYCASGVGGINFFEEYGINTNNMMEVKTYYIQVILPPSFDYDRVRSTKFRSEDYCYCDTCSKFCPYVNSLIKGISLSKERRFFLRWKVEHLTRWTDKTILRVFYFPKPQIARTILETALYATRPKYSALAIQILLQLEISNRSLSAKDLYRTLSVRGEEAKQGTFYYELRKLKDQQLVTEIPQKPAFRGKPSVLYNITDKGKQIIGL